MFGCLYFMQSTSYYLRINHIENGDASSFKHTSLLVYDYAEKDVERI